VPLLNGLDFQRGRAENGFGGIAPREIDYVRHNTLDAAENIGAVPPPDCELLALNQALSDLTAFDPRQAQIVELRCFGGLSEQEVAAVVSLSRSRVTRSGGRCW
jgi:DNA-directed RNA polymerase specialized sigma24 family protein